MRNREFEDYIKERLYDYADPVDPAGWDALVADRNARKRRKVLFIRFTYGATAVAAAVVLVLFLFPGSFTHSDPLETSSISLLDTPPISLIPDSLRLEEQKYVPDKVTGAVPRSLAVVEKEVDALAIEKEIDVFEVEEGKAVEVIIEEVFEKHDIDKETEVDVVKEAIETFIPDTHLRLRSNKSRIRRFNASEGWSIAMASSYSNAAGEMPFSPSVQKLSGKTRIFSSSTNGIEKQEYSLLSLSPPVSFGVNFQKEINSWLSLGVGVNYTLLQSKFSNAYDYSGQALTIRQSLHYVGLPLGVLVHFVHQPKLRVYASTGGMVEKAVTAHSSSISRYAKNSESFYVKGLQWSVYAGLGVEYSLSRLLGVYLEPGIGYFFDSKHKQPRSIRTVQPTQLKAEFGLRVRI